MMTVMNLTGHYLLIDVVIASLLNSSASPWLVSETVCESALFQHESSCEFVTFSSQSFYIYLHVCHKTTQYSI